ncbi:MAG TPA: CvpA family protein [Thermomicrobiales bacterium]|nr:CvpA family protein [Thermomicrobiales bacterium]
MTIFLVLDILLILLIVLFMPIGFWRGPIKELFVTLGVIFGVLLADFWARPWGSDLTDYTELTAGSGAFIIAMTFLVASTFILGYGLGATLAPSYHGNVTRVLGAAIAAVNGALLLSFSLQYVRLHLLSTANEESLNDSFMARFLLDGIGWLLLGTAFVAVPLLLFVLVSGRRAYEPEYDEYDYLEDEEYAEPPEPRAGYRRARVADAQTNVLPPRVPGTPREDDETIYKAEPEPHQRRAAAETRPLIVTEPQATSEPAQPALAQPRPAQPTEPEPARQEDREPPSTRMGDTDPHIVLPTAMRASGATAEPATEQPEDEAGGRGDLAPGYARCATCHAVLSPDISICPNCGTLR